MVIVDDFHLFCTVWATPTNHASEAIRDGSSCANSSGSNLFMKLTYFEDVDVFGCVIIVIVVDFHLF